MINAPIVGYNCHEQFADKLLQALNITLPTDPPMIGNTINQSQETPYRLDFFNIHIFLHFTLSHLISKVADKGGEAVFEHIFTK